VRVGIIGLGVVGQAQVRLFSGYEQVLYDIARDEKYPRADLASCDFAVICVSTPASEQDKGRQHTQNVVDAYAQLPPGLPTVIRSTVVPGTTDWLVANRDRGALTAHVPEFMQERAGSEWCASSDVPFVLLGGSAEARRFFRPHLGRVFPSQPVHECSSLTSELAKYTANIHWATKVTFVNELARICEAHGSSWAEVRQAWLQDPRVHPHYTLMDGFPPGFGGPCWPKDLRALIMSSSDHGYEPEFLHAIEDANARFLGT
jgi:UDPglucose 6-dehydrogenase